MVYLHFLHDTKAIFFPIPLAAIRIQRSQEPYSSG